jgi:hypothetical protein
MTTYKQFVAAEEAFSFHGCTRAIVAPLKDDCQEQIEDLFHVVLSVS